MIFSQSVSTIALCLVVAIPSVGLSRPGEMDRASQVVGQVFGDTGEVRVLTMHLTKAEHDSLDATIHRHWPGDSLTMLLPGDAGGVAVLDNVRGKDQLITYVLSLTTDHEVLSLDIIAYREPYGGEIRNSSWRDQFAGKTPHDRLRPGREIRNITGATISVRAVTDGVRKILATLSIVGHRIPLKGAQ